MIPTHTLCSLDRFRGMVDVYNYTIRVVNILTFICEAVHRVCPCDDEMDAKEDD